MAESNGNGTNGRVTNIQLREAIDASATLLRAEQKNEHLKTRAWVAVVSAPAWIKGIPAVLAYIF